MKTYTLDIKEDDILVSVYRKTANAAQQRADALHVATEDNKDILMQFLESGKRLVEAALGRYGNGMEYPIENGVEQPSVLKYSMPASWDFEDDINERVDKFLADYVTASWYALTAEVELPVIELMSILNKRKKPL